MKSSKSSQGMNFYLSMLIVIISVTFYQVLQKEIASQINPLVSLIITCIVAILFSMLLYFIIPGKVPFMESLKNANYASYMLGLAIVGIEIGFLLVYRTG